ncbi:hypothetical protein BJ138DRAFT_1105959 [Hygrophoropsis aurantiaca]|uniref:Uncharacterized protein n=1 Tax=Hygrophoropsis aurantiaca TaxID=72124 RepID=A0ACB7ZWQ7_9AGAM|nr:hypothetical protein BJ138DRAFT_1105959 [Hygrophoropsis aurantiaca]
MPILFLVGAYPFGVDAKRVRSSHRFITTAASMLIVVTANQRQRTFKIPVSGNRHLSCSGRSGGETGIMKDRRRKGDLAAGGTRIPHWNSIESLQLRVLMFEPIRVLMFEPIFHVYTRNTSHPHREVNKKSADTIYVASVTKSALHNVTIPVSYDPMIAAHHGLAVLSLHGLTIEAMHGLTIAALHGKAVADERSKKFPTIDVYILQNLLFPIAGPLVLGFVHVQALYSRGDG